MNQKIIIDIINLKDIKKYSHKKHKVNGRRQLTQRYSRTK